MSAIFAFFEVLFGIVFDALTKLVKTVFLASLLVISLFFGGILILIQILR